jgi:hypothetical protein
MGALLGRIGREIGDRVEGAVMLHELFRMPASDAEALLRATKSLLEQWQATYTQARRGCAKGGSHAGVCSRRPNLLLLPRQVSCAGAGGFCFPSCRP